MIKMSSICKTLLFVLLFLVFSSFFNTKAIMAWLIGPRYDAVLTSGNGRFVLGIYSSYVTFWDLENLWEPIQPIQMHILHYPNSSTSFLRDKPIAISEDGRWFTHYNGKNIYLNQMDKNFPGRKLPISSLPPVGLQLSPNGNHIAVITSNELALVEMNADGFQVSKKPHNWPLSKCLHVDNAEGKTKYANLSHECLEVDWNRLRIAVGTDEGKVIIIDGVNDWKTIGLLDVAESDDHYEMAFSLDGSHLLVHREHRELKRNDMQTSQVLAIELSSQPQVQWIEQNATLVPGGDLSETWLASYGDDKKKVTLKPIDDSGKPMDDGNLSFNMQPGTRIVAVLEDREFVLIRRDQLLYLARAKTGLPTFELYTSKVRYWFGQSSKIPHLTPHNGVSGTYQYIEEIATRTEKYWENGIVFGEMREQALLWLARLVTTLGERYDRVWFQLLTYKTHQPTKPSEGLADISAALVSLNRCEELLKHGNAEQAAEYARSALNEFRSNQKVYTRGKGPALDELGLWQLRYDVDAYRETVERELWLVFGNSLAALGAIEDAATAYRQALRFRETEWRAYGGLLRLYIDRDPNTASLIAREAAAVLKSDGWTDKLPYGYPDNFFYLKTRIKQ